MRHILAIAFLIIAMTACTGNDTSHWYCYDAARAKQQGGAPHKFNDSGSHRCTNAELDEANIPPDQR